MVDDGVHCVYCGRRTYPAGSAEALDRPQLRRTRDHIESLASPRRKEDEPTVTACARCNEIKGSTPIEVFLHWLKQNPKGPAHQVETGWKNYRNFCHELLLLGLECPTEDDEPPDKEAPKPVYDFTPQPLRMSRRRKTAEGKE